MKKLLALSLVASMCVATATAQIERTVATDSTKKEMRQKGEGRKEKIAMMKELGLNKDQMKQMRGVKQDTKAKIEALKAQQNLSEAERKTKIKAIREEAKGKYKLILTPEQFEKMQSKLKEKMGKTGKAEMGDEMED
jgi:periplasmic protein CpxP/Spy